MSQWQPIATVPKDTRVLVFYPGIPGTVFHPHVAISFLDEDERDRTIGGWMDDDEENVGDFSCEFSEHFPTHWQPLPEHPKAVTP